MEEGKGMNLVIRKDNLNIKYINYYNQI